MTDLSSLIARLEQAESGSRELDAEIARGLGWTHRGIGIAHVDNDKAWFDQNGHQVRLGPPQFSTSIDAAMTLAPPDGWLNMGHRRQDDGTPICSAGWDLKAAPYAMYARAKTFPLALCIASLKARSRVEGK